MATGTVTDTSHEDWTWDEGYADSVVNHGWTTVTSGSSLETSGSLRTATGGGSYSTPNSTGNITENLSIQASAAKQTTWGSGSTSGAWSFATASTSGSATYDYDYTASGSGTYSSTWTNSSGGVTTSSGDTSWFRHADETLERTTGSLFEPHSKLHSL